MEKRRSLLSGVLMGLVVYVVCVCGVGTQAEAKPYRIKVILQQDASLPFADADRECIPEDYGAFLRVREEADGGVRLDWVWRHPDVTVYWRLPDESEWRMIGRTAGKGVSLAYPGTQDLYYGISVTGEPPMGAGVRVHLENVVPAVQAQPIQETSQTAPETWNPTPAFPSYMQGALQEAAGYGGFSDLTDTAYRQNILEQLNAHRAANGLGPIGIDASLQEMAHAYVRVLAGRQMDRPDHIYPCTSINYLYQTYGQWTIDAAAEIPVAVWWYAKSPSHNAQMLRGDLYGCGIGIVNGPRGLYIIIVFFL